MKSFHFIIFLFFTNILVAQDVDIPPNLLEITTTSTTTARTTATTIENEIDGDTTTTRDDDDESLKGSWIKKPIIKPPKSDNLLDASNPNPIYYTYPQIVNSYPYPFYDTNSINCNNNTPVLVPPIYNNITDEPEIEEKIQCPIEFVQNGTECVSLHINNCPNGYSWRDNRCILSHTVCPLNFEFNGTMCVENQLCPPNHVWKDERCVQPEPECPDNWRWNGEKCVVISVQCQPGSILIENECVFESITCPSGYTLVSGKCEKPKPNCPHGFELTSTGFCSQVNVKCPTGSVLVNGQCQRVTITCPEDTQKIGDQCFQFPPLVSTTSPSPQIPTMTTTKANPIVTTTNPPRPSTTTLFSPGDLNTQFPPSTEQPLPPADETTTTSSQPPIQKICPDDFTFYRRSCYKCPENYNLCNGICLKKIIPCDRYRPLPRPPFPFPQYNNPQYFPAPNINININITTPYVQSPPQSNGKSPYTIINNIEPINNTIHNINNITNPVTLNNVNENNIYIYTETQCSDGTIRTTIIKNNQTITGCFDETTKDEGNDDDHNYTTTTSKSSNDETQNEKCCEVITPRQCKKRQTDTWICTHRKYHVCNKFCKAERVYLKPKSTTYVNKILTIPPLLNDNNNTWTKPCYARDCPPVDCSGCIDGSFNCSHQCFTYPCSGTCHYINQEEFCKSNTGEICSG